MDTTIVMEVAREAVITTLLCALPLMLAALLTGLAVSILQAATQINEATLSFVPKIVAVFLTLLLAGVWIIDQLVTFTTFLFERIPFIVGA